MKAPLAEPKLHESVAESGDFDPILNKIADQWAGMYDESVPSMGRSGQAKWEQQVDIAIQALEQKLIEACDEVEENLIGGEYYRSETASVVRGMWDDLTSGKPFSGKRKY